MCGSSKFCQRWSNFDNVFFPLLVEYEGREGPNANIGWLVGFVALRPKSTAMVIAGQSVHLTTLFPGQA